MLINKQWPVSYKGQYGLKQVNFVSIIEFDLKFNGRNRRDKRYLHDFNLARNETGEFLNDTISYKFIEITNFVKRQEELETDLDIWLFLLKNITRLTEPIFTDHPIFKRVFEIAEFSNLTPEEQHMYTLKINHERDYLNTIDYAREEGLEQGKKKAIIAIAKKMKSEGIPHTQISKITKLPIKRVEKL